MVATLLFNFAFEYTIRKVQEKQVELKLNGTNELLAHANDVNLLGDNIDNVKKNTETLIDFSKEIGLEINVQKTKYMLLSHPECRSEPEHKNCKQIGGKCVTVQIFGDNSNKSKFDSGEN
jgi:hypothetical protein